MQLERAQDALLDVGIPPRGCRSKKHPENLTSWRSACWTAISCADFRRLMTGTASTVRLFLSVQGLVARKGTNLICITSTRYGANFADSSIILVRATTMGSRLTSDHRA